MNIELIYIFVQIVKSQSFTKAAEVLRLPKSTVSKSLARLEAETRSKLLIRTTRSQTLTLAGRVLYDQCVAPIQAIDDALKSLSGSETQVHGTVKITAPEDLGTEVLAPAIGRLIDKHPDLNFELHYTDQVMDLVSGGYDLAVRIGHLKESALKIKKAGEINLILVASPGYLKKHPKILKPEDLQSHSCLSLGVRPPRVHWPLKSKSATTRVTISPRISSNQMSSLLTGAMADAGVALVPDYLCKAPLKLGKLVHVLPQWSSPGLPVSILSPLSFSSSARLRAIADSFAHEIQTALR